jgi:hypothetical protein
LLLGDLLLFGSRFVSAADQERMLWPEEVRKFLSNRPGIFRVTGSSSKADVLEAMQYGIQNAGGFNPAVSRRYTAFFNKANGYPIDEPLVVAEWKWPAKALDLMNVKYFIIDKDQHAPEGFKEIFQGEDVAVLENPTALQRAFLVHKYESMSKEDEILNGLFSEEFHPRASVILEEQPTVAPGSPLAEGTEDKVNIETYSSNKIKISTDSGSNSILVILDSFFPGWKAFVDGREVEILKADYLFRAIPLQKGKHVIEMRYEPSGYKAGKWISAAGLFLVVSLFFIETKWKTRQKKI